ncbi:MAG: sigma-70 family RNA polymerase sigma factor [Clostridia bacterium]|nr:sigma-70 family RNA polymerase sigma factor [Clostridia bacterium]
MKQHRYTNEELCVFAKNGDVIAQENLIKNNIGFITEIAKTIFSEYGLNSNLFEISLDDLIQEGRIALWKCTMKFNQTGEANYLTYAKPAIRNAMLDLIRKSPTAEVCLDDFIKNEERLLLSELISDPYSKSPEQIVIKSETIKEMYKALNKLDNRERVYLIYRFGFEDGKEHSVADSAFRFSLSVSRAKFVEKSALKKMRKLMFL